MFATGALIIGLLCALISRALITVAAFSISFWWGLGVFLPFGPMVFRHNFPDQARGSRAFGFATLPCIFLFVVLSKFGKTPDPYHYDLSKMQTAVPTQYAIEKPIVAIKKAAPPTADERRIVNAKEFERLRVLNESLRLRKRDLLRSDVDGNRIYIVDLALYNQALEKATAEKNALTPPPSSAR